MLPEQLTLLTVVIFAGRIIVAGVLILAGWLKLKAGAQWFLRQILAYELVKGGPAFLFAYSLPWAEILCGIWLLVGWQTSLATIICFVLLWGFSAAVMSTFLRGRPVDCGCFGQHNHSPSGRNRWTIIYRNLGLMGGLLIVYIARDRLFPLSLEGWLNEWRNFDVAVAKLLTLVWVCSLIITLCLQWFVDKRLHTEDVLSRATS